MNKIFLQDPEFLLLLLLVIAAVYYFLKKGKTAYINYSSERFLGLIRPTLKVRLSKKLIFLRAAVLICFVIALARPQSPLEEVKVEAEGIDIMLAIDVSSSMLAEDFKLHSHRVNRLKAVKSVVKEFIEGRQNDRIGLVAFASRAYMVSPLTLDYGWLLKNLERVKIGMIEDGTAIGSGISSSLNRLKSSKAKSKIIILLTDGRNNAGRISPDLAAQAAKALGIKIYTIGAGSTGLAPYPVKDFFGDKVYKAIKIDIDEDTLKSIAEQTGAQYFRAENTKSLRKIYREIDKMEKTKFEEKGFTEFKELFPIFLGLGLILLLIEIILGNTYLRRIP